MPCALERPSDRLAQRSGKAEQRRHGGNHLPSEFLKSILALSGVEQSLEVLRSINEHMFEVKHVDTGLMRHEGSTQAIYSGVT